MANFVEIKFTNPKLKQSEVAKELTISASTLQRYRREINMLSTYRIPPSSNTSTRKQKVSNHTEHDLKSTSNDLKRTSNDRKKTSKNTNEKSKRLKSKNTLRSGDPNDDNSNNGKKTY